MTHDPEDLITIFNRLFDASEHTVLVRGEDEPLYLPACHTGHRCEIQFAHGFFASALHEIAHWCIAGRERRQLVDFGYWYQPDGRSQQQQHLFEQVEVKPQALEWIFHRSCDHQFRISADNLNVEVTDSLVFKQNVIQQVHTYLLEGLPSRAASFRDALQSFYKTPDLSPEDFSLLKLG
ncbi:elongation factor P hydroxylase [Gynuella sp.]|uniref:elongation factor P hydroxylase n=1 Tax=Gynuella sp. TaxID=2969146 RepID=UPI003D12F472